MKKILIVLAILAVAFSLMDSGTKKKTDTTDEGEDIPENPFHAQNLAAIETLKKKAAAGDKTALAVMGRG